MCKVSKGELGAARGRLRLFCSGIVQHGESKSLSGDRPGFFSGTSAQEVKATGVDQRVDRAPKAAAALVVSLGCAG